MKVERTELRTELRAESLGTVIFLDWVNLGSPWWSRSLTGLDPVDLIGRMEWI